jgi:hypothetical protein
VLTYHLFQKATDRQNARRDTEAAGKDFAFLENPNAQSPEHSDAENPGRMCIDEPMYQSPEVSKMRKKYGNVLTIHTAHRT